MKKIMGVVLAMICVQTLFSQNHFGVKAGFNLATIAQKYVPTEYLRDWHPEVKPVAGCEAGVFYHVKLASRWVLCAEADLTMRGAKTQVGLFIDGVLNPNGLRLFSTDRIFYFNVPVVAKYTLHRFSFGAGPGIGFNIFSTSKFNYGGLGSPPGHVRKLDAGANLLAGYQVARKWEADLCGYYGLTSVSRNKYVKGHNLVANLSLLYTLK